MLIKNARKFEYQQEKLRNSTTFTFFKINSKSSLLLRVLVKFYGIFFFFFNSEIIRNFSLHISLGVESHSFSNAKKKKNFNFICKLEYDDVGENLTNLLKSLNVFGKTTFRFSFCVIWSSFTK